MEHSQPNSHGAAGLETAGVPARARGRDQRDWPGGPGNVLVKRPALWPRLVHAMCMVATARTVPHSTRALDMVGVAVRWVRVELETWRAPSAALYMRRPF